MVRSDAAPLPAPEPYTTYPPEPMPVGPVILEGRVVRLEPLARAHLEGLVETCADPAVWTYMPLDGSTREGLARIVEIALAAAQAGSEIPFATVERASGRVVGGTRFMAIDAVNHRLEIGYTFIARPWQRTAVNSEAKLLMLEHAFARLRANRVEFKTDSLNEPSRAAILRLGARFEGVFRNHLITRSGRLRHSAYYSITVEEWPAVRAGLEERLRRYAAGHGDEQTAGGRQRTARSR